MPQYKPIILDITMNAYGRWVTTISIAPGYRIPITCATLGGTRQRATEAALRVASTYPAPRELDP